MEIIDKVREYLSADDIEMVQLGVVIMQQHIPLDQWEDLLKKGSERNEEIETIQSDFGKITWIYNSPFDEPRYRYLIKGREVHVWRSREMGPGVYQQISGTCKTSYNIQTFDISTFSNALKSYKQPIRKNHLLKNKIKNK